MSLEQWSRGGKSLRKLRDEFNIVVSKNPDEFWRFVNARNNSFDSDMVKSYLSGTSASLIAKQHGVTSQAVSHRLHKLIDEFSEVINRKCGSDQIDDLNLTRGLKNLLHRNYFFRVSKLREYMMTHPLTDIDGVGELYAVAIRKSLSEYERERSNGHK